MGRVAWSRTTFPVGLRDVSETMMKTMQLETGARNGKAAGVRQPAKPGLYNGQALLSQVRTERSRIQWPTELQMQDVSKHLARISRSGRRSELAGDYFMSGDLAYQMQEIIRLTRELLKKSERTRT
jgi:hypothetical protein